MHQMFQQSNLSESIRSTLTTAAGCQQSAEQSPPNPNPNFYAQQPHSSTYSPSTLVSPIALAPVVHSQLYMAVLAYNGNPVPPDSLPPLPMLQGEVIEVTAAQQGQWWEGRNSKNVQGFFLASCVKPCRVWILYFCFLSSLVACFRVVSCTIDREKVTRFHLSFIFRLLL